MGFNSGFKGLIRKWHGNWCCISHYIGQYAAHTNECL